MYVCAVTSAIKSADKSPLVTPPILRALMNLTDADVGGGSSSNNSQAIASFIGQYYNKADLEAFLSKYNMSSTGNLSAARCLRCVSPLTLSRLLVRFEGCTRCHTPLAVVQSGVQILVAGL